MVWADAGTADQFDSTKTYYYLPLSGYTSLGKVQDVKYLHTKLKEANIHKDTIYGVRKGDMDWVKQQTNWVNLDTFVEAEIAKGTTSVKEMVKQSIDFHSFFSYNEAIKQVDTKSPYVSLYNEFKDVKDIDSGVQRALEALCQEYKVVVNNIDPTAEIAKYKDQVLAIKRRYPLLSSLSRYSAEDSAVAEYINAIDQVKGI
jgi:hypothetical protein